MANVDLIANETIQIKIGVLNFRLRFKAKQNQNIKENALNIIIESYQERVQDCINKVM